MSKKIGFTLMETLLAIATVAVISGIVVAAVNPFKHLADARNAQRRSDTKAILDAVMQYSITHNGFFAPLEKISKKEVCQTDVSEENCELSGGLYLGDLTAGKTYLTIIPIDPSDNKCDLDKKIGTCYYIEKDPSSPRITISAPNAELNQSINITN